jgi:hypothetical protein
LRAERGLPKTSSVDGFKAIPDSAASLAWSISMKNLMLLSEMSFFSRLIVSATG